MSEIVIHDKERARRRDAINAVRLNCLDTKSAVLAARTFNLSQSDLVTARRLLEAQASDTSVETEDQRVNYLLSKNWNTKAVR